MKKIKIESPLHDFETTIFQDLKGNWVIWHEKGKSVLPIPDKIRSIDSQIIVSIEK